MLLYIIHHTRKVYLGRLNFKIIINFHFTIKVWYKTKFS